VTAGPTGPGGAGTVTVVGLGPGDAGTCTPDVVERLRQATDLVGYGPYLALVAAAAPAGDGGRRHHASDNREEAARARLALDLAAEGRRVAVVSSGDPGVFAMAAAVMEQLDGHADRSGIGRWDRVSVEVLPGVSAAQAAAARAGAPLGHDFCVISLSDNLKPWQVVERRLDAAAAADFVIALYNPASRQRPWQLGRAVAVVLTHRDPGTPVVIGRDIARPGERVEVVRLSELADAAVDMRSVVIVGSSTTRCFTPATGPARVYTPRRYPAPVSPT
jgi:precorrin-3B C17-methyltransferase